MELEEWAKVKYRDASARRWFLEFRLEQPEGDDVASLIRAIAPDLTLQERMVCLSKYPEVNDWEGVGEAQAMVKILDEIYERVNQPYDDHYSVPDLTQQTVAIYHAASPEQQKEVLWYLGSGGSLSPSRVFRCLMVSRHSPSMIALSVLAVIEPALGPADWEGLRDLLHQDTRSGLPAFIPQSASPRLRVALLHHELVSPHLHVVMNAITQHKVDPLKYPEGLSDTLLDALRTLKNLWACGRCP